MKNEGVDVGACWRWYQCGWLGSLGVMGLPSKGNKVIYLRLVKVHGYY